jgi:hypothetical protein
MSDPGGMIEQEAEKPDRPFKIINAERHFPQPRHGQELHQAPENPDPQCPDPQYPDPQYPGRR